MKVMITGGAGSLGQRLARKLLERGMLQGPGGRDQAQEQLLLNDYSRRGFVDGRVLRLPTVSVRPGKPNKAASSFASGIIREPLAGIDASCQAEDGIRDLLVTGVQTCALPICSEIRFSKMKNHLLVVLCACTEDS